jgi:hypothetical protein
MENFIVSRLLVQVFHPSQDFERSPFLNGRSSPLVAVTFLLNLIKICQLVRKLLRGHTDGQTVGDLISLIFLFLRKVG